MAKGEAPDSKRDPGTEQGTSGNVSEIDDLYRQLRDRFMADMKGGYGRELPGGEPAQAMTGYAEEFVKLFTAAPSALLSGDPSGGKRAPGSGDEADPIATIANAYLVWATRGLHYWGRLGEQHGAFYSKLIDRITVMRADPERFEEERRALMDDAGAYLREMADLSMQEARVLRSELDRIGTDLRAAMDGDAKMDDPRRFAKAKP